MKIILYVNTAENNRMDKTSYLEQVVELEGVLRQPSSIINPVINIQLPSLPDSLLIDEDNEIVVGEDNDVVVESDVFYRFNYAYIPMFQRYYFISDIVILNNKMFQISMNVDVLMSFRDNIIALPAYVERNENTFNSLIIDESLPLEIQKEIIEYKPTQGELVNTVFSTDVEAFYNIVINTVFMESEPTLCVPPEDSGLPAVRTRNFAGSVISKIINQGVLTYVMRHILSDKSSYADSIVSIVAYPFEPTPLISGSTPLTFGYDSGGTIRYLDDTDFARGKYISAFTDYVVVADFVVNQPETFLDCEPYCQYEIYIPFYGWHTLNYDLVKGHRLILYYVANNIDGSATVYLWDWTYQCPVFSSTCQLGVKIPISSVNAEELTAQKNANNLNLAVGLVSSALSIGLGVVSHNPLAIAGGAISGAKTIASTINANARLFPKSSASFGDPATSIFTDYEVRIRKTRNKSLINDDTEYKKLVGKPLDQTVYLLSLTGFTVVSEIHLENINAFDKEKDEIESILKSGVIL